MCKGFFNSLIYGKNATSHIFFNNTYGMIYGLFWLLTTNENLFYLYNILFSPLKVETMAYVI
jgi:hypothetical protein